MAHYYPPPQPLFPRPQAVVTQLSGAPVFTGREPGLGNILQPWLVEPSYVDRIDPAPVFPAPAVADLGFLRAAASTSVASTWLQPVCIELAVVSPVNLGSTSQPVPLQVNTAFNAFIETVAAALLPPQRLSLAPVFPLPPSYPFIPLLGRRDAPIASSQFAALAATPVPFRILQTNPPIGNVKILVFPTAGNPASVQAATINAVWLVPKNAAQHALVFPTPPAPTSTAHTISSANLPIIYTISV